MKKLLKSLWLLLPRFIRNTGFFLKIRSNILKTYELDKCIKKPDFFHNNNNDKITLTNLSQIDEAFVFADTFKGDDEQKRWSYIKSVYYLPGFALKNIDPDSDEYKQQQLELYKSISNRTYSSENEKSEFYSIEALKKPYPYNTDDPKLIAHTLSSIANIISSMQLDVGGKVLEFGPGWGNLTIQLALTGYDVTAIDIEKNFLDLIRKRLKQVSCTARIIHGDFLDVQKLDNEYFDVIIFQNCFHHCFNFHQLIERIRNVMKLNSKLIFAYEPISNEFLYPWGLRMDGESVYQIRNNGWMELGFKNEYFYKLMDKNGYVPSDSLYPEIMIFKLK